MKHFQIIDTDRSQNIIDTDFFKWMILNYPTQYNYYKPFVLKKYLASKGFKVGKDFLSEIDARTLSIIYDYRVQRPRSLSNTIEENFELFLVREKDIRRKFDLKEKREFELRGVYLKSEYDSRYPRTLELLEKKEIIREDSGDIEVHYMLHLLLNTNTPPLLQIKDRVLGELTTLKDLVTNKMILTRE